MVTVTRYIAKLTR